MNVIERKKDKNSELRKKLGLMFLKLVFTFLQFEYNGERLLRDFYHI